MFEKHWNCPGRDDLLGDGLEPGRPCRSSGRRSRRRCGSRSGWRPAPSPRAPSSLLVGSLLRLGLLGLGVLGGLDAAASSAERLASASATLGDGVGLLRQGRVLTCACSPTGMSVRRVAPDAVVSRSFEAGSPAATPTTAPTVVTAVAKPQRIPGPRSGSTRCPSSSVRSDRAGAIVPLDTGLRTAGDHGGAGPWATPLRGLPRVLGRHTANDCGLCAARTSREVQVWPYAGLTENRLCRTPHPQGNSPMRGKGHTRHVAVGSSKTCAARRRRLGSGAFARAAPTPRSSYRAFAGSPRRLHPYRDSSISVTSAAIGERSERASVTWAKSG